MPSESIALNISAIQKLKNNVLWVTLSPERGTELPHWTPGSHIGVRVNENVLRQYSLCGDSSDSSVYRIAVKLELESRGGSQHIHDAWAIGDRVVIEPPRNNFKFVDAPEYLFVAGGIGITPLLPMIKKAADENRNWKAVYRGRQRNAMPFANALKRAYGDLVQILASDEGHRPSLEEIIGGTVSGRAIYCCGPSSMMDEAQKLASSPERESSESFYLERFVNENLEGQTSGSFELELARSGKSLAVPADKTIIDVLEENGLNPTYSCREGTCGTCETDVLEGVVDHRDSILDDDERAANDCMFICVSRSKSDRLVIDF